MGDETFWTVLIGPNKVPAFTIDWDDPEDDDDLDLYINSLVNEGALGLSFKIDGENRRLAFSRRLASHDEIRKWREGLACVMDEDGETEPPPFYVHSLLKEAH
jgi:hypothetical protein